jgi:hypothetical protein
MQHQFVPNDVGDDPYFIHILVQVQKKLVSDKFLEYNGDIIAVKLSELKHPFDYEMSRGSKYRYFGSPDLK